MKDPNTKNGAAIVVPKNNDKGILPQFIQSGTFQWWGCNSKVLGEPFRETVFAIPEVPVILTKCAPKYGNTIESVFIGVLKLKIIQHKGTLGQVIEAGLGHMREAARACSFSSLFSIGVRTAAFFPLFAQLGASISLLLNPFLSLEYLLWLGFWKLLSINFSHFLKQLHLPQDFPN